MQPDSGLAHTKHFFRAVLIVLFLAVAAVFLRVFVVPPSWGMYGWYRGDDLAAQRDHEVRHHGDASCTPCHGDIAVEHASAGHASVRCELCHAPLVQHVREGARVAEMPMDPTLDLCGRCHWEMDARPADFPVVNPRRHLEGWGMSLDTTPCITCHKPHRPL